MSEEHNKDVSNNIIEEDDPLAELARIVAGEISSPDEIEDSTPTEVQTEPEMTSQDAAPTSSAQDDETPNFDDMLSVEIEPEEETSSEQEGSNELQMDTVVSDAAEASLTTENPEPSVEAEEFDSLEDDLVAALDVPDQDVDENVEAIADVEPATVAHTQDTLEVNEPTQYEAPSEIEDETSGFDGLEETEAHLEEQLVANLGNIELEINQAVEDTSIATGFDPLPEDDNTVQDTTEFVEDAAELPVAEESSTTSMQLDELIEETVMADLSQSTFEDELSNHLENEFVSEPAVEPEIEEEVFEEQFSTTSTAEDLDRIGEALEIQHEPEPLLEDSGADVEPAQLEEIQELSTIHEDDAASDLEQEMSAAFDNAVEHTQSFSDVISEQSEGFSSIPDEAEQTVEIDFETAFAEELSIKEQEAAGWDNNDTQAAASDFEEAAIPALDEDANEESEFSLTEGGIYAGAAAAGVAAAALAKSETVQSAETQDDTSSYLEAGEDNDADPGHMHEIADELYESPVAANENERSGGGMKYAVAALVISLFAGVIVTGYGFLGKSDPSQSAGGTGEVAIIKADAAPFKIKPENPGGRVVSNTDNVTFEKVEGNDVAKVSQEKLVSKTEEPANIDTSAIPTQPSVDTSLTPKSTERITSTDTSEKNNENSGTSSTVVAPRVVQTLTVKPDGTILQTPSKPVATPDKTLELASQNPSLKQASEILTKPNPVKTQTITSETQQPEAPAAPQTSSNSAAENSAPAGNTQTSQSSNDTASEETTQLAAIDGAISTGETGIPTASPLPKPKPKPKPKPVAKPQPAPTTTTAAVAKSEWVVQVSSQTTPEAAQSSFVNMRNRFSALQGRAMSIQRANVNGTTYYRVRVQTASRNDANQLCANLKSAGGSCFVTR